MRRDKFTWVYILWFLPVIIYAWGGRIIFRLDPSIIPSFGFFLLLLAIPISLCWNLVLRRWRRMLSLLLTLAALFILSWLLAVSGLTPFKVRFAFTKQRYLQEIDQVAKQGSEDRLRVFPWDYISVDDTYYKLVYDESDELALPIGQQSAAWRDRAKKLCDDRKECIMIDADEQMSLGSEKIDGHFYIYSMNMVAGFP